MKFYTNVHTYRNTIRAIINESGERKLVEDPFPCDVFLPTNKETAYKTLDGNYLQKQTFDSIIKKKEFVETYSEIDNYQLYGNTDYHFDWIRSNYNEGEYDYCAINIFNIDIEVASDEGFPEPSQADWPINAFGIKYNNTYYVWGTGIYKPNDKEKKIVYYQCEDEEELLERVIVFWNNTGPDIITGWNVKFFDIPYFINRIKKIIGNKETKLLSPWKLIGERTVNIMNNDIEYYDISGVSILDYMDLYKNFTYTARESYKLDFIGHIELDLKKITIDEATEGYKLYKTDYQKFIEYNIRDIEIVSKLDEKLCLIQLVVELAYKAGINYTDVHSPVKMWESFIHKHLNQQNIKVTLRNRHGHKNHSMVGAYVKTPHLGFQNWVVSFDTASLYPNLIRTLNIGPETLVTYVNDCPELLSLAESVSMENIVDETLLNETHKEMLKEYHLTLAANGVFFTHKKQSFMSKLVETMFSERVVIKGKMLELKQEYERADDDSADVMRALDTEISQLDTKQHALKIALNSLYGAMGNAYFQFFSIENAEAITKTGQVTTRWIERKMNLWLNKTLNTKNKDYVVASDTDSVYINMSTLVEKIMPDKTNDEIVESLGKMCKQVVEPKIKEWFQELCDILNVKKEYNSLKMKREVISNRAFWTAKKRYAMNIFDEEGVRLKDPKLKVMGIESVKSSTPAPVREKLKEALKIILNDDEKTLQDFTAKFKREFKKLSADEIAFPKSVNGMEKYMSEASIFKKGTPMHCRGSLLYNNLIKEKKLGKKYETIHNGEKIKYVYLKEPNPLRNNVISILQFLPTEFGLESYIDYDMQFEKAYAQPLKTILDTINWSIEKRMTLEGFFG